MALVVQALVLVGLSATPAAAAAPLGLQAGDLVISDPGHHRLVVHPANGDPDRYITGSLVSPQGVVVTPTGDVVVIDESQSKILKFAADGTESVVANRGGINYLALDGDHVLYGGTGFGGIGRVSLSGDDQDDNYIYDSSDSDRNPNYSGIAVDDDGDVVGADWDDLVTRIHGIGRDFTRTVVPEVSHEGGTFSDCFTIPRPCNLRGLALTSDDRVLVADTVNDQIWESDGAGGATHFGSGLSDPDGVAVGLDGTAYVADTFNGRVVSFAPGTRTQSDVVTGLLGPTSVAVVPVPPTQVGDVFVATADGDVVRMDADGDDRVTLASGLGTVTDLAVDDEGNALVSNTGGDIYQAPADGSGAVLFAHRSSSVSSLAFGPDDTLYLADATGIYHRASGGAYIPLSTAASLTDIAVDAAGTVYAAGAFGVAHVDDAGFLVGAVSFDGVAGLTWDPSGHLLVSDESTGLVYTVATDDGDTVHVAAVTHPADPTVLQSGDLLVADGDDVITGRLDPAASVTIASLSSQVTGLDSWVPRPSFTTGHSGPVTGAGNVGSAYSWSGSFQADENDGGPVSFTLFSGDLPDGLTLNQTTGTLTGTPTAAGTYTFRVLAANEARGVVSALQTIVVGKRLQTITFTSGSPTVLPGDTYTPAATGGGSGQPVTFSISPVSSSVCSYDSTTGKVTFLIGGPCTVWADQAGDADYDAAPTKALNIAVGLLSQSAPVFTGTVPTDIHVGDTYTPETSITGSGSGLSVVFGITGQPLPPTFINYPCDYDPVSGEVTFTHVGTCRIQAVRPGDSRYRVASTNRNITVAAGTLTFTGYAASSARVGDTWEPTSSAGGAAYYDVDIDSDPGACSVDYLPPDYLTREVTFTGVGTCVLSVSPDYPSDWTTSYETTAIEVLKAAQTVTFTSTAPTGAAVGGDYTPVATGGPSGNPVTFAIAAASSGVCSIHAGVVSFDHAGDCVVRAEQEGDATYDDGLATQTITVDRIAQSISFGSTAPTDAVVGDTYDVAATATSGGTVTFSIAPASDGVCSVSAGTVSFQHVGDCVVQADQGGTTDHLAAPTEEQTITVGRGAQTVSFGAPAPAGLVVGDVYPLAATATSGGVVVFSVDPASTSVCAVSGTSAVMQHVGTCVVRAAQPGTSDYLPALTVTQSIVVNPGSGQVWFDSTAPEHPVVGETYRPQTDSLPAGAVLAIAPASADVCSLDGGLVTFDHVGTCTVRAVVGDGPDTTPGVAEQSIAVSPAETELALTLTRRGLTAEVTVVEPGAGEPDGEVEFTVDGEPLGTAVLDVNDDGDVVAVLDKEVESGGLREVVATFTGSDDYEPSDDTVERGDPTITATVTSKKAKQHGWYRTPVRVRFTCTTTTAPLVAACPAPVKITKSRDGWQSILREVVAEDGGKAFVVVTGIKVDRDGPKLRVAGAENGQTYKKVRTLRCVARDRLSGVASCKVTTHRKLHSVVYRAVAFDRAGNRTVVHGRYFVR